MNANPGGLIMFFLWPCEASCLNHHYAVHDEGTVQKIQWSFYLKFVKSVGVRRFSKLFFPKFSLLLKGSVCI